MKTSFLALCILLILVGCAAEQESLTQDSGTDQLVFDFEADQVAFFVAGGLFVEYNEPRCYRLTPKQAKFNTIGISILKMQKDYDPQRASDYYAKMTTASPGDLCNGQIEEIMVTSIQARLAKCEMNGLRLCSDAAINELAPLANSD